MTILKEFTTWPQHQELFYKITGSAINFQVKASRSVEVGLTARPDKSCAYRIQIRSRSCSIEKESGEDVSKNIHNLISGEEFRNFWISWRNKAVAFGRGSKELLRLEGVTKHLKYVTFDVTERGSHAEWKCYLPEIIEDLPLKPFLGGEPRWVSPGAQLPDDAVLGGFEGEDLYVMRAEHRGALTPGKFVPSLGIGLLAWGGESHEGVDIEILCGYNCTWARARGGRVPAGAVVGGHAEGGEVLYVGRARRGAHLVPGKVQPSHHCCYIPHEGREIARKSYEVLVVPGAGDERARTRRGDSDSDTDNDSDSDRDVDSDEYNDSDNE